MIISARRRVPPQWQGLEKPRHRDAMHAVVMHDNDAAWIATFDRGFRAIDEVELVELG